MLEEIVKVLRQIVKTFRQTVMLCERQLYSIRIFQLWQGCILSPLLFNLYLNELPFILNNNAKDSILLPDGSHLNCLLYADDLLLISTSAEGLQQSLDRLSKYCQDWLLKINPTKTKVIVFQKKSRKSAIDKHNWKHWNRQ